MDAIHDMDISSMSINHAVASNKSEGKLFLGLLITVILIFPFSNLFHVLYPANILGKSAWIVLPVIIIVSLYFYMLASKKSKLSISDISLVIIVILCWLIFSVRQVAYNEYSAFLDLRFIVTSALFIVFVRHLLNNVFTMQVVAYGVAMQGILVALVRIVNYYLFPSVMISYTVDEVFFTTDGELTRDLLIQSSISANHVVCGMFILLILIKYNISKLKPVFFIGLQFLMMFSTFNTYSRYPMLVAIFFFLLSFAQVKAFSVRDAWGLIIAGAIFFALTYLFEIELFEFFGRFSESNDDRLDKLQVTFALLTNSTTDFLIGSSSFLANSTTVNGSVISDNSYGLVATTFGGPFALLFFAFLFNIFYKIGSSRFSLIFFLYIAFGLGITNSILWEPWVFTAFVGFGIASFYGRLSGNSTVKSQNDRIRSSG
jgi:hypothetical protein